MRQQIVRRDAIVEASADAVQGIFHDRRLHERERICRAIAACCTVLLLVFLHLWSRFLIFSVSWIRERFCFLSNARPSRCALEVTPHKKGKRLYIRNV
jgi:hypothetical protein